jgi:hypothetical protein
MKIISKLFGVGRISMMRVLTFLVVVDIMAVWTATCIKDMIVDTTDMSLNDFPWGVVSVIGLMVTGKAVQRFAEKDSSTTEKESE